MQSLGQIIPELLLGGNAALLLLVVALFGKKLSRRPWLYSVIAICGLVGAILHLLYQGSDMAALGTLFSGLLATDPLALFFKVTCMCAALFCVIISIRSRELSPSRNAEYFSLVLVAAMGMSFLVAANNLLMIYVSFETVSLCSYLLAGWDHRRVRSQEAGLKYVLFGSVASGIMLFGFSLLYGLTGSLNLQEINIVLSGAGSGLSSEHSSLLRISLILVLGGIGFKIAAVPFHMWCPDVYEGAPTPVAAFLSVGPKAAGFALLIRFFFGIFASTAAETSAFEVSSGDIPWLLVIAVFSVFSLLLGNFAALGQDNVKRMLAYSSIAHAGYALLGVLAGGKEGIASVMLYLGVYLLMNMGAFAVVSLVSDRRGSEDIRFFTGMGKEQPLLAVCMTVFLFSLTGLPPTAGFIGKFYLFSALVHNGGYWHMALALFGVLNAVVALYYYARIIKVMYFDKSGTETEAESEGVSAKASPGMFLIVVLALITLALGLYWQPLAELVDWAARIYP
jgi:NADH-quinone oxidoreductase subunit N